MTVTFLGGNFVGFILLLCDETLGCFSLAEGLCVHLWKYEHVLNNGWNIGACLDVGKQRGKPWMVTAGQL